MSRQIAFGGIWTEQKLQILSKYLTEYRKIFEKNPRASFYQITYLDAFAGTGTIPRRRRSQFVSLLPELEMANEEFRKGSARRALEIEPPFHHYLFIEKHTGRCNELSAIASEFPNRKISIVNSDANEALLQWCRDLDCLKERAVVFMDPFGASVRWSTVQAIAETRSVDLWILFPCAAINRLLPSRRKPPRSWSQRLTSVFGTDKWEDSFYTVSSHESLLPAGTSVKHVRKNVDHTEITAFFVARMRDAFAAVADPAFLYNSKGPLFSLIFAAGNAKGAGPGLRIANHLLRKL